MIQQGKKKKFIPPILRGSAKFRTDSQANMKQVLEIKKRKKAYVGNFVVRNLEWNKISYFFQYCNCLIFFPVPLKRIGRICFP